MANPLIEPSDELSRQAQQSWKPMHKKPSTVFMQRMDQPFAVQTNEGVLTAHAGDFVAHDPQSGHFWPVAADYVAMHYEEGEV